MKDVSMSRTLNTLKNSTSGLIMSVITTVLSFAVRTVFIKYLDETYLGLNGLFTNILTMLSLFELGIGNAIIFRMYKPIKDNNIAQVKLLYDFFKKCYYIIIIVISIIGLSLTPFLKYLVNTDTEVDGLYTIYIIYVFDTVASYYLAYKTSLITAYQRERVATLFTLYTNIATTALQILSLIVFRSFYLYLIAKIVCTIVFRFLLGKKVDAEYAFITEHNDEKLNKKTQKSVFKDVGALLCYKIGAIALNGSDNIIISVMIGTNSVGIYSNYYMITAAVKTLMMKVLHGCTASVGNLNAEDDKSRKVSIFHSINYVTFWMFSFGSACLLALAGDFVKLLAGDKFLMDFGVLLTIVVQFYISGFVQVNRTYRETMGLFRRGSYVTLITAAVNILLSILGAKFFGLIGIFAATSISELITTVWYNPLIICKYGLNIRVSIYYFKYVLYIVIAGVTCTATVYIGSLIPGNSIVWFALKAIICALVSNIIICLLTFYMDEFKSLRDKALSYIGRNGAK